MRRAFLLVLAAALVAIAAIRRRVPTYPDWHAYLADQEGDALPPSYIHVEYDLGGTEYEGCKPDPYLERLR